MTAEGCYNCIHYREYEDYTDDYGMCFIRHRLVWVEAKMGNTMVDERNASEDGVKPIWCDGAYRNPAEE